jgi:hypothetical protein
LRPKKLVAPTLGGEPPLFAISGLIVDVNFGLVAIPCIVPARQALNVAFDADAIVRRNEDQTEDIDRARTNGQWAEETRRPEPELLRLRRRQIAEE